MNDGFMLEIRSGEVEIGTEFALSCEGCDAIRYNPKPLAIFDDGNHYYSHWCEACLKKRTMANLSPDPFDEDNWDFVQIDEGEEEE